MLRVVSRLATLALIVAPLAATAAEPFGFQSERRSLFEARDAIQSQVFFEAVRGSGGTARLVLLPFEDHGYRARETIEHVLWEQIRWFEEHVKNAE